MLVKLTVVFLLFILSAANARAEILSQDKCIIFTGVEGEDAVKFCPYLKHESYKAKVPVEVNGKIWDRVGRIPSYNARLIPASRSAFVYVENYSDYLAAASKKKRSVDWEISGTPIAKGYRLRYFQADGRQLWKKLVPGKGRIKDQRISYDGGLIVLLMEPDTPAPDGSAGHWITVYNNEGVRLLDFPKRAGICDFDTISSFWLSKTGKYLMAECGRKQSHDKPYFFQPETRLYWPADSLYKVDPNNDNARVTDEDEESGKLDLDVSRDGDGDSWERTNITLSDSDWLPLKQLH